MKGKRLTGINELEIIKENPKSVPDTAEISDYIFANQFLSKWIFLIHIPNQKVVA